MNPIRKIYNWSIEIAAHKNAAWFLSGIAFAESSFFPIPPDITLIPMCIAKREKAFFYATITTIASVLGGLFGYSIGCFLFETVGKTILEFYSLFSQFDHFQSMYNEYGGWIVFAGGFTPIPYKVITIASGVAKMNLALFFIVSTIGRSLRFYLEAALLWKFGAPIKDFIDKYLGILSFIFVSVLIGGFYVLKYI